MKKITIILTLLLISHFGFSQNADTIPETYLINLNGHKINTKQIQNHGKPFIISFWASWQKTSLLELNNLHELFKIWNKESGVKIFAISIDDPETYADVKRYATQHKWEFDILIDEDGHFEKQMSIIGVPHTILFDANGKIVWQRHEYSTGDEDELHNELIKLTNK